MLYNVFAKIIDMSIIATVVIAVVLIIRALIFKAPKKYAYILWAIVGIRLICPVGISSPLSIYNLVNASDYSIYERHQIDTGTNSAKQSKVSTKKHTGIDDIKLNNKNNQEISKIENDDKLTDYNKKLNGEILQSDLDSGAGRKNKATVENKGNTIFEKVIQVCAFVWITGCIIIILWNVVLLCRVNKKLAQAVRLKDNIYECDSIPTPFVFGIISPKIYIPFRLKESEQGYIISHEKYHIKRKDNIVKLSAFLICILHWFNPFVWLAYSLMIRDMEMSCDEYVLGQSAEDIRKSYSESLLGFATNTRTIGIGMLSFGESDTRKRVKRIMKFKKAGNWIGIMAVTIILISGVICLTDAGTNTKGEKVEKINDMKTGESINKAMKTITASETVDTDQSGTGNENEREYSVKLEDISFKIPADKVTVNNQYDKNRYIKYNYKFLGKEDMCLYVGEPEKDFIAAFSKFNFKRVEEVGEWSYFVNGKEKIIKVNCCEKADGAKYFGCYWEEKGKEFLNVQKKTADDYGMAAKVSAEIAESIEERN